MMNNVSDTPGSVYINNMTPKVDSINKTHLPMRLIGQMGIKKEPMLFTPALWISLPVLAYSIVS